MKLSASRISMTLLASIFTVLALGTCAYAEEAWTGDPPYACEEGLIEVMFEWNSRVRVRGGELTDLATHALDGMDRVLGKVGGNEWQRICDLPEERLDELQIRGEANTGQPVYNLNNIYRLRIPEGQDIWAVSREMEALPGVLLARPVPIPQPAPLPGPFQPLQNYEDPASSTPTGVDAEYAWTLPGGDGTGVTVCDLEYGWNRFHWDISKAYNSPINPNPIFYPAGADTSHGTAVIGILSSDNNGFGTTGICYGATLKTCGTYYGSPSPSWNVAGAMAYAIAALSAGDVILLEQQWEYHYQGGDYVPIEWWVSWPPPYGSGAQTYNAVYAAIGNAVANGIHVVEGGGNGSVDTDTLTWLGDSGAIIVGAGGAYPGGTWPGGDLERLSFSDYGSRFNLQGWGENVVTTGYGDLYSSDGVNAWYTDQFAGTSSASAIVAGAVACYMGYWKTNVSGTPPPPRYLRAVLAYTGTPQVTPPSGSIGPRPDLHAAIAAYSAEWADATSGPLGDTGYSEGVAWGDYDRDGDLDLYLTDQQAANKLLRNDGVSGFVDATSGPLGDTGHGWAAPWGDYDNDGDPDLYLANGQELNRLFRNDGAGGFSDVTNGPLGHLNNDRSVTWADYDNDGDLDLYVSNLGVSSNILMRNDGGLAFVDVTSGPLAGAHQTLSSTWGDYDNDGDLDLYLCNNGANQLLRNDGGGAFVDTTSGALGDSTYCYAAAWGDYDNDGDLDLYLTSGKLLRNDGGGAFSDQTSGPLGSTAGIVSVAWGDYDNDGDLDLYLASGYNGVSNRLLRNDGGGVFTDATSGPLFSPEECRGVAWGDYDNDGDLDLYVASFGHSNKLFRNLADSNGNHWLEARLRGTISNASAIGAKVRVVAGGAAQVRDVSGGSGWMSQNSLPVEFGLGSATTVDTLEILWPSGIVRILEGLAVDQILDFTEMDWGEWADATNGPPLGNPAMSAGVAWGDYDGDGDLDLYVANAYAANKLFNNVGNGTFADSTVSPVGDTGTGKAVAWGDYDNDGDLDLYVANDQGPNKLFQNDGTGHFVDVTLSPLNDSGNSWAAAWGDYDNDGDLDLYVADFDWGATPSPNKLFRNDGGGAFTDVSAAPLNDAGDGTSVAWGDYDNDGDLDLYLANWNGANKLFRNEGNGSFVDATSGPLGDTGYGTGVAWGDYDNDGDLDLYLAKANGANRLFRNDGGGTFTDATTSPLDCTDTSYGVAWADYDNDGDLDLYVANDATVNRLFRNDGASGFIETGSGPLRHSGHGRGVAWGDYDGDGDLDLFLTNDSGGNKLFRNEHISGKGRSSNHWLHLDLVEADGGVGGIGARVRAVTGGLSQIREVSGGSGYGSQNSLTVEFGLGAAAVVDTLEVLWPGGAVDTYMNVAADRVLVAEEGATAAVEEAASAGLPGAFQIAGNYPNPFNPRTTIHYVLPGTERVRAEVFDVTGRRVAVLVDEVQTAGEKCVPWDAAGLASGVYWLRVRAGGESGTRKMILLK